MVRLRKVTVGPDPFKGMNYVHGQPVLGKSNTIHLIRKLISGDIEIFIENNKEEVRLWKRINANTPYQEEYFIDF